MIGIFDSGSGGLTVLKEIRAKLPNADIVYFGDFANLPYGEKTPEELGALTVIAIEKLLDEGATEIVSACNSVSASVAQPIISLLGRKPFKIIEMVGPTVEGLKEKKDKKILIVSTDATKRSGIYLNAFKKEGIEIDSIAIPDLVKAIEANTEKEEIESIIENSVENSRKYGMVVLGCTQFPFAESEFREVFGDNVEIINPAKFVAEKVSENFDARGTGKTKFIISKDSKFFRDQISKLFPESEISVI